MGATNIREFSADIKGFAEKLNIAKAKVVQKVSLDLWRAITKRTPVATGRARANWNLSVGSPSTAVFFEDAKGANSVPEPAAPDVSEITGEESVFIVNNLAYIEALENGHSAKAPNGMVKVSMQEVEATIRAGVNA